MQWLILRTEVSSLCITIIQIAHIFSKYHAVDFKVSKWYFELLFRRIGRSQSCRRESSHHARGLEDDHRKVHLHGKKTHHQPSEERPPCTQKWQTWRLLGVYRAREVDLNDCSPRTPARGISFPFSSSGKEGCLPNNLAPSFIILRRRSLHIRQNRQQLADELKERNRQVVIDDSFLFWNQLSG